MNDNIGPSSELAEVVKSRKRFFMYQDNYLNKSGKGLLYFHTGGESLKKRLTIIISQIHVAIF